MGNTAVRSVEYRVDRLSEQIALHDLKFIAGRKRRTQQDCGGHQFALNDGAAWSKI